MTWMRPRLPVILQAEATECGLACVAMIAGYYGKQTDLHSLRNDLGTSARGATVANIMEIANTLCLSVRPVRAELRELKELNMPAVLHWNFNHFVVLKSVSRGSITIHDPAVGVRRYTTDETSQRFTGIALDFSVRNDFTREGSREVARLWDFWPGVSGLLPSLTQILVLSLLIQLFALVSPFYVQLVVDDVLTKHDSQLLLVLAWGFTGLTLASVVTRLIRGYVDVFLTTQLSYIVGSSVMHHLIRLPMAYFRARHLGDVISRFESTRPIQAFITNGSIAIIIDGALATTTLSMMLAYSTTLGLLIVASALFHAIFRIVQFVPLRHANHESINAGARLDSLFMETIRSLQGIKMAGRENEREITWGNQFAASLDTQARLGRLTIGYEGVNGLITGIETIFVVYLGAREVLGGELTIGMMYAFMAYRSHFSSAVVSIINQLMQYRMLGLHLERVSDITQSSVEPGIGSHSNFTYPLRGEIELVDIGYHFNDPRHPILNGLSLKIEPGEFVAIYGPSGIGKSTLLNIMMGLITPTSGELFIDNNSLNSTVIRSYRRILGAVTQEDVLLSGSIKDNISFFDLQSSPDEIIRCARQAQISADIEAMPMGYESLIGDMGTALSMGQQQRILIARALYRQPRVLLLDEGTAHLDAEIERQVMQSLRDQGITCIYITHNPRLLPLADKIVHWHRDGKFVVSDRESLTRGDTRSTLPPPG